MRQNRISNRVLLLFIASGVAINAVFFPSDILQYARNGAIMFFLSLVLWQGRIVSAADSKLLTAYAFFIPVSVYRSGANPFVTGFFSFSLLENTFVPFAVFFFAQLVTRTTLAQKKAGIRAVFGMRNVANVALSLFGLSVFLNFAYGLSGARPNYFANIILLVLASAIMERFAVDLRRFYFAVALAGLLFQHGVWFDIRQIAAFSVTLLVVLSIMLLKYLSQFAFARVLPIGSLKVGMLPVAFIELDKGSGKYRQTTNIDYGGVQPFSGKKKLLVPVRPDGLLEEDLSELKKASEEGSLNFSGINVYQTAPFAPMLALGALLTLAFSGSIFSF